MKLDAAKVRRLQTRVGVTADGSFGPRTLDATLAALAIGVEPQTAAFDAAAFFASARTAFGGFSAAQVQGIETLLAAMRGWPLAWQGQALGMAWHETARTMQPIKEHGGEAYFRRMYDPQGERPHVARALGNVQPGDGARFAGRGYVQLTGRTNYNKASAQVGVDLIADPDAALRPDVAARVLRWGMETGAFTGKKLADYLPRDGAGTLAQHREARRIINGTDKADLIAGHAMKFQAALQAGGL